MLNELIEVVNILSKSNDRFQQAEEARRIHISELFLNIARCLDNCAERLKNNKEIHGEWGELKYYSEDLPRRIDKEVGKEKSKELSDQLMDIANKTPKNRDIASIKDAAGKFRGFANTIHIPTEPDNDTNRISRRKALTYTVLGIAGFSGSSLLEKTGYHPLSQSPSISWNMHTFLGEDVKDTILYNAPQQVCDLIRTMTDGRFNITLKREGTTEEILTKVNSEDIECGYGGIYYTKNKHKALFFGCAIPFGLNPQEQTAWLNYKEKEGDELSYIQSLYQDKLKLNIIPFPAGATGSQMGGWFKTKINSLDDIKGQTMRIPGLGAEVLKKMGMNIHDEVNSVSIKKAIKNLENDLYLAVEWASPYDDYMLGLHKAAKFYYYPGWWEPSTTFDVQVNKSAFNKLPSNYKEIFKLACRETYSSTLIEYDQKNASTIIKLEKEGIEFHRFNNEFINVAQKETEKLLKTYSKNDEVFAEV